MSKPEGLTLLELLITVLITSILLSISLPGFKDLLELKKSDAVVRKLIDAITLARTTAIASSQLVTLCRSSNGVECGGRWQDGMILFTDGNGDREINQTDSLQYYFTFPEADGSLTWRAFQNRQYMQITSQGFTRYQNGNFTYCPASRKSEMARQLIINRSGRVRNALDSDGDGLREDSNGQPIICF